MTAPTPGTPATTWPTDEEVAAVLDFDDFPSGVALEVMVHQVAAREAAAEQRGAARERARMLCPALKHWRRGNVTRNGKCTGCDREARIAACDHSAEPRWRDGGILGDRYDCGSCGTQLSRLSGLSPGSPEWLAARAAAVAGE